MENTKFKAFEDTILELQEELKPLFKEIERVYKAFERITAENTQSPLLSLLERLTKTARRHDLTDKVEVNKNTRNKDFVIVGTNHNGLGIQYNYSSILEPINNRFGGHISEQNARDILFDDNASIELTSIIKKSNQKTFLKILKILKKYNLVEAFDYFKNKNLGIISVNITDDIKIDLDISKYYAFEFELYLNANRIGNLDFRLNSESRVKSFDFEEEVDGLKEITDRRFYENFSLSEIKLLFLMSKNKDILIKEINNKIELLNSVVDGYKEENQELNKLLEPLLALEKL